ncbi:MAG: FHA domain-containing protein [Polyangiaceae bacterium]
MREPSVSRLHARITRRGDAFVVEDLGSENGLFLGPRRRARCEVGFRQLFRVGRVALELLPDVSGEVPKAKPSEPPAIAIDASSLPSIERFPSSSRLALTLTFTAALLTSGLFGALHLAMSKRRIAAQTSDASAGITRLLTISPSDVPQRVQLDAHWNLDVPSAAVTAPRGIAVVPVASPRAPATRLLAPAGPGILVESVEPSTPGVGLRATYTGTAEESAPLLGRYRPHRKQFDLFGHDSSIRLLGLRETLVPLRLGKTSTIRRVDDWSVVYDEKAFPDVASDLHDLAGRLGQLRSIFRELGYTPLTSEPVVVLDADTFDDDSWCATAVLLPSRTDGWTRARLERAYFAAALGQRVDCATLAHAGACCSSPSSVCSRAVQRAK